MKAKIKATGEIISVDNIYDSTIYYTDGKLGQWTAEELDFFSEKQSEVLEGYVARDGNGDLYFYDHKPIRDEEDRDFVEQNGDAWFLHKGFNLSSVTWLSEPKKVRLTIEIEE